MWDLPRPGLKPMSPALAGGFLTTAPPGKSQETQALHDTIDQMDLLDTYKTFHLKASEYTSFSSAHEIFSRIDHTLGHKATPGKFKKIEIISSVFSDHAMRLEINYRKNNCKNTNTGG